MSLNTLQGDLGKISDSSKKNRRKKRKDSFELLAVPASWAGDTAQVCRNLSSRTQVNYHLNISCIRTLNIFLWTMGQGAGESVAYGP